MSYIATVLQPGERVVHVTKLHWFLYLPAIGLGVLALACLPLSQSLSAELAPVAWVAAAILAALALVAWLRGFVRRSTTELAVTDRRVVFKSGLLHRHTIEMNLAKVESVDVDQSILGRIFRYGTVTVHGTGGGIEPLRNISAPLIFRNHVTAS